MQPGIEHTAIKSYFNANMSPTAILSELIDNAFDANAESVEVEITKLGISVCDDGDGIENMEHMVRIGMSGRNSDATTIGQYGVGAKHALLAVGSKFDIATRTNGKCIEIQVDWQRFLISGFSPIPDPLPVPVEKLRIQNRISLKRGWTTRVAVLNKHNSRSFLQTGFLKSMAIRYRPALKGGASIVIIHNGTTYNLNDQTFADPAIDSIIEAVVIVNGKRVSIRAGHSDEVVPSMTGMFLISYGPRIIEKPTDVSGHNVPSQLYVEVNLGNGWRNSLGTHKDRVITDRDELLEAVWDEVKELAETINALKRTRRFELVCNGLNKRFKDALKQLRKKGTKRVVRGGGVTPVIDPYADTGPGNGPVPNPERPLSEKGHIDDGDNEIEKESSQEDAPTPVNFEVIEDSNQGQHCFVNSSMSELSVDITVKLDTSLPIVEKAFTDDGDALLLMVAHALAEHFCSANNYHKAVLLFGADEEDDAEYDEKTAKLAGSIIENLASMESIKESETLV